MFINSPGDFKTQPWLGSGMFTHLAQWLVDVIHGSCCLKLSNIIDIFTFFHQVRKDIEGEQMAQAIADTLEASVSNQVLEPVIFSCLRLHQRFSFLELVLQNSSRLLVYKTTIQNLCTKINDAGQAVRNSSPK